MKNSDLVMKIVRHLIVRGLVVIFNEIYIYNLKIILHWFLFWNQILIIKFYKFH